MSETLYPEGCEFGSSTELADYSPPRGSVPQPAGPTTEPPPDFAIRASVRAFAAASGRDRHKFLADVAAGIEREDSLDEEHRLVDSAVEALVADSSSAAVDNVIDLLVSICKESLERFLSGTLRREPPPPDGGSLPKTRKWVALIRAAGTLPVDTASFFLARFSRLDSAELREAALDALGDIAAPWSITEIERVAANDPSPDVRRYAAEVRRELLN